jgi:hypothetical protein
MNRRTRSAAALGAAAVTTLALAAASTTPAMAITTIPISDDSGSVVFLDNATFHAAENAAGDFLVPGGSAVVGQNSNGVITITFPVTGGNATVFGGPHGTLDIGGTLTFENSNNGNTIGFSSLEVQVGTGNLLGIPTGGNAEVRIADFISPSYSNSGTTQNYSTDSVVTDPSAATRLDKALGTTFYVGAENETVGGLTASWTTNRTGG